MLSIQFMQPFYTKVTSHTLRLVFAYQYFSIKLKHDGRIFHFIPIEGREMKFNLSTMQVENANEVFVFQQGTRFVRVPLNQLILAPNIQEFLMPIIEKNVSEFNKLAQTSTNDDEFCSQVEETITYMELENFNRLIDYALEVGDKEGFMKLTDKFNRYNNDNLAI